MRTEQPPMMECGHAANSIGEDGDPSCAICAGIRDGWNVVAKRQPNLAGRKARCDCGREVPSNDPKAAGFTHLPFFEHRPDRETDRYYCGHAGWN